MQNQAGFILKGMIRLVSGSNDVVVTLTENSTVTDPIYLFRFFNQQNNTNYYVIQPSDTSEFKQRYNRFDIILTADPNTLAGEIDLPLNGLYNYEVYQTSLSVPFSIGEASEAVDYVVKSVEKGLVFVVFDETPTETFEPASIEYKVYDPTETPEIPALDLTFDGTFPVVDPSSVDDWNTFFDLPDNGTPFDRVSVVEYLVKLYGGGDLVVKNNLFSSGQPQHLLKYIDNSDVTIEVGDGSFSGCTFLNEFKADVLVSAGVGAFSGTIRMASYSLPSIQTIGAFCFNIDAPIGNSISFSLPELTNMGGTVGNNLVFFGIVGKSVFITIPSALMTCNSGQPDGDIQYLQANNTVTIIEA